MRDSELTSMEATMMETRQASPSPARVAAGKRNRTKRKGLTEAGRQRLREAALRSRPWQHACGPRTEAGKAKSARNGKARQVGPISVREARARVADLRRLLSEMREVRTLLGS
jgi:hypothetical protein